MASLIEEGKGRWRVQWRCGAARRSVRLGKQTRRVAEQLRRYIESLVAARQTGEPLDHVTAAWLAGLPADSQLRERLARVGLVQAAGVAEPPESRLGYFLEQVVLARPDVKPATLEVWRQPCRNLKDFFGPTTRLADITPGRAEQFAQWLRTQGLAPATLAKRLAFARTFFHVARKHRLIEANPFSEVKVPRADVSARQHFVDRDTLERLMRVANPTWRTILALARLGGLRCPSEVLSLEWRHIDWATHRIIVPSPKTERYAGQAQRVIPLFADLRPYLDEAQELAAPGQTHVVGGGYLAKASGPSGWRNVNLRTQFERLIRRAGLTPWPRLFHNLRSSRETELLDQFPLHTVARWLGHDPQISLRHYAQTTDEHFARAVGVVQNPVQGSPARPEGQGVPSASLVPAHG